jgi:DNA-binding ferritin-like protein
MELHKLFQSQYTELEEIIDIVAERIINWVVEPLVR